MDNKSKDTQVATQSIIKDICLLHDKSGKEKIMATINGKTVKVSLSLSQSNKLQHIINSNIPDDPRISTFIKGILDKVIKEKDVHIKRKR